MQASGKLLILFIFGTALAGGIATLWFQYDARRRSREFWGAENALLISRAPKVELLQLTKAAEARDDGTQLTIESVAYEISERKDISKARGFVHVRDALIRDAGFEWDKARGDCEANWEFVFRFEEDSDTVDIVFDFACERARLLSGGQEACISPIFDGIKEAILRELPQDEDANDEP